MNTVNKLITTLHNDEIALLQRLRAARKNKRDKPPSEMTFGARIADTVAATMGSWPFIIA